MSGWESRGNKDDGGKGSKIEHADKSTTKKKFIGWSFPPYGYIKCNVDGSAPPVRDIAGCGGVFRDATGSWVYEFARRLETCTSSAAELLAISTGLDVAWVQGFRKLILVTDSRTAAALANKENNASVHRPLRHDKALVGSIWKMLENRKWDDVKIEYNGEDNGVADWLADLSHGLQVGDQIELPKLPDGRHSCQDRIREDVRLAKTKTRWSLLSYWLCFCFSFFFSMSHRCLVTGTAFVLVMFLLSCFLQYVVHVPG